MDLSDDEIKQVILERIDQYQPDTIITWDTEKGLYGHVHHIRVGQLVVEVCQENSETPEFPVETVYGSTLLQVLSDGEVINIHFESTEGWW